ncbi:MAG: hypothetical protein KKA54_14050 [Proteobacteria bacterium]|nr:hypothetical protein [Pseudomonadota bacterium]
MKSVWIAAAAGGMLGLAGIVSVVVQKQMQFWLPSDLLRGLQRITRKREEGPVHVIFAFVDHFEPGNGGAPPAQQRKRVNRWVKGYPLLARKHLDADGVHPQHTFFFPPHYDTDDHLEKLVRLCGEGFSEIEMHLHHDRQPPWPDDENSLRQKILDCIESFSRFGVFCLPDGKRRFAFIHGDWALANSLGGSEHCGVNDEITILEQCGCFADFTFPVSNEAQPRLCNRLFYGQSTPKFPKGYNRFCHEISVGNTCREGLIFVQGPIGVRWRSRTHCLKPSIEQSNLSERDKPTPGRIDYWLRKAIHIPGRPNWIFIKIHTHGVYEFDWPTLLGKPCDDMFHYLGKKYNDGKEYVLHYVSAREMYNIIRAAEDGKAGNPNSYRDYEIPRYVYLPTR